jgi:hypothetical protein
MNTNRTQDSNNLEHQQNLEEHDQEHQLSPWKHNRDTNKALKEHDYEHEQS